MTPLSATMTAVAAKRTNMLAGSALAALLGGAASVDDAAAAPGIGP
jgi:hypothetical protein